jgi:hypothetical protein
MKKYIQTAFLLFMAIGSFGQIDFAISQIPQKLKENADAVVRFDQTEFIIESYAKIITKHHWAVTVFTEKGEEDHATFDAYYNNFEKIKKIEGCIYDQSGKLLKKLKASDIEDIGLSSFSEYITDSKKKTAKFDKKYYPLPYTVEFSFEEESTNTFFFPSWNLQNYEKVGIQNSTFTVKAFDTNSYRKREINLPNPSKKYFNGKYHEETWEAKDLEPVKHEEFSANEIIPKLYLASVQYTMGDYSGPSKTWNDIAAFYATLNKGRDILPSMTVEKLKSEVGSEKDPKKVIDIVYKFMQSSTRYFLISLGVGGWQSMTAEQVATKGYGDCKALTNYTIALLKQVGIKGYPALIYGGSEGNNAERFEDFPMSRFNHVVACIPLQKDTVWLECTSQTNPSGYMGSFTGNRKALLVKEKGGELIKTINYLPEKNIQKREINVKIVENGDAQVTVKSNYSGIQQETRNSVMERLSQTEQKQWLHKALNLPNFEISNFSLLSEKTVLPKLNEEIKLVANRYATTSGKRLFVKPNIMTKYQVITTETEERKTKLFLNPNSESFLDEDQIEIEIPVGYTLEYLPKEINLKEKFGEYRASTSVVDGKIYHKRFLKIIGGNYSKEDYAKWVEFLKTISKTDNQKAVFVKVP